MFKYVIYVLIAIGTFAALDSRAVEACGKVTSEQRGGMFVLSIVWPILLGMRIVDLPNAKPVCFFDKEESK